MSENSEIAVLANDGNIVLFWCPACDQAHQIRLPEWGFDGDLDRPTVTGSILVTGGATDMRCHSFVTAGKWQYLGDCTHAMAGTTVDGVPFRPAMRGKTRDEMPTA